MIDVVVPAARAELLERLLGGLRTAWDPALRRVVVAWDGAEEPPALDGVQLVRTGGGRGPAAARNAGWRASDAEWVAFLDDDVLPPAAWGAALVRDLQALGSQAAGTMGRVRVPLPADRPPTDWERNVARLADTPGIVTADCTLRHAALKAVGGFDERFPRAYREDTDLELRLQAAGWTVERGAREIRHPVRPAGPLVSLGLQRGNADDVLLWALHGAAGHVRLRTRARYAAVVAAGIAGLAGSRAGRLAWALETARFFARRAAGGPRDARELAGLALTSAAIPPLALWHTAAGLVRHRAALRRRFAAHVARRRAETPGCWRKRTG